jgi:tetratricopeptide (TPR) repeat protein
MTASLMEKIVSNKNIEYKSKTYNRAHEQYYKNMDAILRKAHRKNVPVVISELICNIKDLRPFCSVRTTDYPAADQVFDEALAFEKKGEYAKAKALYYQAKDLDCIRFRASEDINRIIHRLSEKYNATLVPMKSIFENHSPNGLIGANLVTEHLHPNIDGYFLMADAFYNVLVNNVLQIRPDTVHFKSSAYYRQNWGFTDLDTAYAGLMLYFLQGGWPFKPDTTENNLVFEYKPKTIIDSLAYLAVRYGDFTLEMAHKKLAYYYIMHQEPDKAFQEYNSLFKINPYSYKEYLEAGDLLSKSKDYDNALMLYLSSLKIKRDVYPLSKIGEIYSLKGEYEKAIPYLEEVRATNPGFLKEKMLEMLYKAYSASSDTIRAKIAQTELQSLTGNEKKKKEVLLYSSPKVKSYIDMAISQLRSGKVDEALMTLQKANTIQETSIANRIIGEILIGKNDKMALGYLMKAYYEYNSDPEFLNTLCYASIHFNNFNLAAKILSELKQLAPANPNIKKYEKMITRKKEVI